MARQWTVPGGGLVDEDGTKEYFIPDVGVISEDQAAGGGVTKTVTTSLEGAIQKQRELSAALAGAVQKTFTRSTSVDAGVAALHNRTAELDAAVLRLATAQASLETAILIERVANVQINAALAGTALLGTGLDANLDTDLDLPFAPAGTRTFGHGEDRGQVGTAGGRTFVVPAGNRKH